MYINYTQRKLCSYTCSTGNWKAVFTNWNYLRYLSSTELAASPGQSQLFNGCGKALRSGIQDHMHDVSCRDHKETTTYLIAEGVKRSSRFWVLLLSVVRNKAQTSDVERSMIFLDQVKVEKRQQKCKHSSSISFVAIFFLPWILRHDWLHKCDF